VRTQGARSSGRQVALHLRELGHRRIAFVSPYNPEHTDWARERLSGVRDVYGENAVVFCSADPRGPAQIWNLVSSSLTEALAPAVQNLAAQAHAHAGISDRSWVDVDLPHLFNARYAASQAQPLFAQAAADPTLTAWVCANDACGVNALRYLSGKRIRVPGDVSVAGFDGSRGGLVARLASFDFNIPALVDTILRLLLRPEKLARHEKTLQIDVPGLFLLRETVARV
jgi:DNA-binding LacI/PurR family transcriptional regulator